MQSRCIVVANKRLNEWKLLQKCTSTFWQKRNKINHIDSLSGPFENSKKKKQKIIFTCSLKTSMMYYTKSKILFFVKNEHCLNNHFHFNVCMFFKKQIKYTEIETYKIYYQLHQWIECWSDQTILHLNEWKLTSVVS